MDDTLGNKIKVLELVKKDWTPFEYNYYFTRYSVDTLIETFSLKID